MIFWFHPGKKNLMHDGKLFHGGFFAIIGIFVLLGSRLQFCCSAAIPSFRPVPS
jgi:hypothetical protein